MTTLELAAAAARLSVAPAIGGAITTFMLGDVAILRTTTDEAIAAGDVRRTSCYPLVPYSNRIRDATLRFAGRTFALARNFGAARESIHGVGWQRAWRVLDAARDRALLELAHVPDAAAAQAWPWPFVATLGFRLAGREDAAVLTATLGLRNAGDAPFPFGLGFHPFFPKNAATTLGLDASAVWENDASQLPVARIAPPSSWRFAPPRALGGVALDNVFAGWGGRATLDDARATRRIEADGALAFCVVYAPADEPIVAIEPVTHETDAFNREAAGARGTGMRVLRPGEAFSCTMRIEARALAAR